MEIMKPNYQLYVVFWKFLNFLTLFRRAECRCQSTISYNIPFNLCLEKHRKWLGKLNFHLFANSCFPPLIAFGCLSYSLQRELSNPWLILFNLVYHGILLIYLFTLVFVRSSLILWTSLAFLMYSHPFNRIHERQLTQLESCLWLRRKGILKMLLLTSKPFLSRGFVVVLVALHRLRTAIQTAKVAGPWSLLGSFWTCWRMLRAMQMYVNAIFHLN